jgi:hypothetical protein
MQQNLFRKCENPAVFVAVRFFVVSHFGMLSLFEVV